MLRYNNIIHKASFLLIAFVVLMASCKKQDIDFGHEALTDDPNTSVVDTLTITMGTFQLDSFVTSSTTNNLFVVGAHNDPIFGKYESKTYMQLGIPSTNNINACTNCTFDSVVFVTRFTGASYGDTTEPFTLNVNRMTERVVPDVTPIGYNVDTFSYDPTPLGSIILTNTRPTRNDTFSVKLNDAFGIELFNMLKNNSDTITDATKFTKYLNGLVLTGKGSGNNSMYYFTTTTTTSLIAMRIYYTTHNTSSVQSTINFPINPTSYLFNGFTYDKSGTNLSAFIPRKRQRIPTSSTGDNAYMHGNSGLFPYMSFPYLLSIKELHPYVKVIKAELEITPSLNNYGPNTYYTLPPSLNLFTLSDDNLVGGGITTPGSTSTLQTGNLVIDRQLHVNTKYTYDLTSYVNGVLKNGIFAQSTFVLIPATNTVENRLILENAANNKAVKLKLYVLGL